MAVKVFITIANATPVPCVTNNGADWAYDAQGNQLMLPPGVGAWYWAPETLTPDLLKYYVTFKEDAAGNRVYDLVQLFDLKGDFPVLAGLPKQEVWTKYKYCKRVIQPEPEPEPEPEPQPGLPTSFRFKSLRWDNGPIVDVEWL